MAQVYGSPGLEWGDQQVCEALRSLPKACVVYAQPELVYRYETSHPDYVIVHPEWGGVIVLEVKDWIDIEQVNRHNAWVRMRSGKVDKRNNPLKQARRAAHILSNMLEDDKDLQDYGGRRDYTYAYACVFPHFPSSKVQWLEQAWGQSCLLGRDDLKPDKIGEKIANIYVPAGARRGPLSESQTRVMCTIIDGTNKIVDYKTREFKGIYDRVQEEIIKEPVRLKQESDDKNGPIQAKLLPDVETRIQQLESEMPADVATLKSSTSVRLVRGFAGTGKTDVLILRAHYLHEQNPELDILVTTFNDPVYKDRLLPELRELKPKVEVIKFDTLCAGIYRKKHGCWNSPQNTKGLLANMAQTGNYPLIDQLGTDFIADEFCWMKETGRTSQKSYVEQHREGRGGSQGRRFGRNMKTQLLNLFEVYQNALREIPAYDWVDLHEKTWRYLQEGITDEKQYDVILIDEAQHFAPTWIKIIQAFLKPEGTLFICDDPSQSVYRHYSWRQKGVEVVGRTRWLRVPYRNTRQIFKAAFTLIEDDPLAQKLLAESGEQVQPDIENAVLRDGPLPQAHYFPSWQAEREFVTSEIKRLIQNNGVLPNEIGILHDESYILKRYRADLPKGVQIYETKRQTGLEYKVVFIPQIQKMSDRQVGTSWEEDQSRQRLKYYMTITRARQQVYMLYGQNWPTLLEPIRPYAEWIRH